MAFVRNFGLFPTEHQSGSVGYLCGGQTFQQTGFPEIQFSQADALRAFWRVKEFEIEWNGGPSLGGQKTLTTSPFVKNDYEQALRPADSEVALVTATSEMLHSIESDFDEFQEVFTLRFQKQYTPLRPELFFVLLHFDEEEHSSIIQMSSYNVPGSGARQIGTFTLEGFSASITQPVYTSEPDDPSDANIVIRPKTFWAYDPGDGPVYDEQTGEKLRAFPL